MDFLKTLLAYVALTVAFSVQEGPLPQDVQLLRYHQHRQLLRRRFTRPCLLQARIHRHPLPLPIVLRNFRFELHNVHVRPSFDFRFRHCTMRRRAVSTDKHHLNKMLFPQ